mgnify:CR=1 FL=1
MNSCGDVCDRVVEELNRLGFGIDPDDTNHDSILWALGQINLTRRANTSMLFLVDVSQMPIALKALFTGESEICIKPENVAHYLQDAISRCYGDGMTIKFVQ